MKILVADDDRVACRLLESVLTRWGYEVVAVADGAAAVEVLSRDDHPPMAILDWMMPGLTGLEFCQRVREQDNLAHLYLVVLTSKDSTDPAELRARVRVGERVARRQ